MDLEPHLGLLEKIAHHYVETEVLLVPDIAAWRAEHVICGSVGADDSNPIGQSLWGSEDAPNRILLKTPLAENVIQDHLFALYLSGFRRVHYAIEDNITFVKHLVLHEVAHIKHNWGQDHEKDCDRWALRQLRRWK